MKKIIMAIVATVMALPTFAQYSSGDFSFDKSSLYYGARIGLNMSGIGGDASMGTKTGMTLGGVVGMRVSNALFLESGLYYTQRGGKEDGTTAGLNYLEIPALIKYGIQATDEIAIIPFVGPYFSYAISGRIKNKDLNQDQSSFRDGSFKHPDMGFKFGVGADYNKLYLEIAYQAGVANISKADPVTAHGHAFNINFGVNF